jgi:phosphatidate cytidylyltransferase
VSEEKAAAPVAAGPDARNLFTRVASAVVLVPLAIAAAWAGGWYWTALVTLCAIGLFVEWLTVTGISGNAPLLVTGAAVLAIAAPFLAQRNVDIALLVLALGVVAVAFRSPAPRSWAVGGFLYAAAAQVSSIVVRLDRSEGFIALVFILLIVWCTDIGGYFAGRTIGGPKLWVRVSPNKTWAGAAGGFILSLIVAAGFAVNGFGKMGSLLMTAAALSVASQLGDLFESAIKRRFGVKDSSHIIPGHGGLMDRLDGYVAAVVLAAILGIMRGGPGGAGTGLMVW